MKLLVTGAQGQLGRALRRALDAADEASPWFGAEADWADVAELDISRADAVDAFMAAHGRYDVVFNCAAMTNVDGCEAHFDAAFAANALGPMNLARACASMKSVLVHVSTDYVFEGTDPVARTERDVPAPVSAYGRSKLAGEGLARAYNPRTHVVRTAWLYGEGHNFVATMLRLAQTHDTVTVVDDQWGNPTSADDLARQMLAIAANDHYGVWHCTNEGTCSWADLAEEAFLLAGVDCKVERCSSERWKELHPEAAARPHYSSLDNARLRETIGNQMRPWREALRDYLLARNG